MIHQAPKENSGSKIEVQNKLKAENKKIKAKVEE